uniref:Bm14340 n=1 Tax=Brugia malayi TaxID=6279 RepID=A0A1I9GCL5_BRUMA|nr:Bm14340 [Brugia malayi]
MFSISFKILPSLSLSLSLSLFLLLSCDSILIRVNNAFIRTSLEKIQKKKKKKQYNL